MRTITALLFLLSLTAHAQFIDWQKLRNPVYQREGWSVKDASMIYHAPSKHFYLFFGAFFHDRGKVRSHVASVKTKDFITFSEPLFVWSGAEQGWKGLAAPEIMQVGDRYILTYNSWGDLLHKPNQLFYAESTDLENWRSMIPLAKSVTRGKRTIDAALAYSGKEFVLTWKVGRLFQKSRIAVAPTIEGPWKLLGRPIETWMENGQIIQIDGRWNMVMTGDHWLPYVSELSSTEPQGEDWLNWGPLRQLEVPLQHFNTEDRANAGHLRDWREHDGHFYLLYAGNTEKKTFIGRGDNKLGLARSRDGINWEVPPAR
jgi:hypothetical protein